MSTKQRIVYGLIVAAIACFLSWCGGFDFDHRGGSALFTAAIAIGAGVAAATCPIEGDKP
jgi:hypothetical protein